MTSNGGTVQWRLSQLEKQVCDLDTTLEKLMTNDIPHLKEQLSAVKTRMDVLAIINVGAIVLALVINKFL